MIDYVYFKYSLLEKLLFIGRRVIDLIHIETYVGTE